MTEPLALPPFTDFADAFDAARYRPVPNDWSVAVSDVVSSTAAIAQGRYKDVNMAGAATIACVTNACRRDDLPFAFGGDGAVVLIPPEFVTPAENAMRATQRMCREAMGLNLRGALIPMAEIRKRGRDVLVAAHDLGSGRRLAMLAGGGIEAAETLCKSPEGAPFTLPEGQGESDLTGLSCRWEPLHPKNGVIMALVVHAKAKANNGGGVLPGIYRDIYGRLVAIAENFPPPERGRSRAKRAGGGDPGGDGGMTPPGPASPVRPPLAGEASFSPARAGAYRLRVPPRGMTTEAALQGTSPKPMSRGRILMEAALSKVSLLTGWKPGGFDARAYRMSLPAHSDYRKYADSLRMVIDCTETQANAIRAFLDAEWKKGTIDYGTHTAKAALMTCFVRSTDDAGHIHFIDGADGGYALAAAEMKGRMIGAR